MTKVGLGLRLREAWKLHWETKPAAPSQQVVTVATVKDVDRDSQDTAVKQPAPVPVLDNSDLGYRHECITVDARQNKKGEWILVKGAQQWDPKVDPARVRKGSTILDPYCMVVTRRLNRHGEVEATVLEIQSPGLVQLIREVVKYYPDNTFRIGDSIKFDDPPKLLYYYRKELTELKTHESIDERIKTQIGFALNFLYSHIGGSISGYETFLAAGMIKYHHLWMMFRPGSLLYEHATGQLSLLQSAAYTTTPEGLKFYSLACHNIDYNGEKVGKVGSSLQIQSFENPRTVSSLPVLPLEMCQDPEEIKRKALIRAERFLRLRGMHNLQHATKGRVMVDPKTFLQRFLARRMDPENVARLANCKAGRGLTLIEHCKCVCPVCVKAVDEKPEDYDHELRELPADQMLLCASTVLGFALSSRQWVQMRIDDLADIVWAEDAVEHLVMDKRQKKVLSSIISSPIFTDGAEGDVIGWKGRGLVMLLHGQPGTGKTLTAETVCESLRRPLYIVSGGELGVTPEKVEKQLEEILELSKLWKAVILIDEADVFLEQRSGQDIVRNNFVSVFLRRLEYFEGILMLTTNRVEQFDEAFISRIHLALHYPELEPWMRKEIWAHALRRLPSDERHPALLGNLDEIATAPLNGRVISYAVRTAKAIADADGKRLTLEHLWDVVSVHRKFIEHVQGRKGVVG